MRCIGYIRVSTGMQAESGAGLRAQIQAIQREVEHRQWTLVETFEDAGASGRSVSSRPGLQAALAALDNGTADLLIVAKADRLSRSVSDFSQLLQRYPQQLHVLDLGVDLSSAYGEMVAHVVAAMAQLERRLIGERTRAALAVKRSEGQVLGRPRAMSADAVALVHELRADGLPLLTIADELDRRGVPTPTGRGRWSTSGVRRALTYTA